MKLHLSQLNRFIDLPTKSLGELRQVLDEMGLEVKNIEGEGSSAIFTIETLANRGDTLSALGIARELSARFLSPLKFPSVALLDDRKGSLKLSKNTNKCLRYALLEVNLDKQMRSRPEVAAIFGEDLSEKHPVVDLMNYIQLEIGQPMHAFDRDAIEGEVIVDELTESEEITALDGKSYKVPVGAVVIRDRKKILAVGGVIGCANSMVKPGTTRVAIESATFDPVSVRLTRRAMNINTEASHVFERGSDIENVKFALQRTVYLLGIGGVGGAAQALGLSYIEGVTADKRKLDFNISDVRKEMNLPRLKEIEILSVLKSLGFVVSPKEEEGSFTVQVPSWRLWEVKNSEELIEEVARIFGLKRIALDVPPLSYEVPALTGLENLRDNIEPVLHGRGFFEVITKGFTSGADLKLLSDLSAEIVGQTMAIKNAVEGSYSHLKTTNLLHLARLAVSNSRRNVTAIKVYEWGRLFSKNRAEGTPYEYERDVLNLATLGRWSDTAWRKPEDDQLMLNSFFGTIRALFTALNLDLEITQGVNPFLHPGKQARLLANGEFFGTCGVIHPKLATSLEIPSQFIFAELEVDKLIAEMSAREYSRPSDYPIVWRDLTLCVPERQFAGEVISIISKMKISDLVKTDIVDDFKREGESFRRISYRITFQNNDRTLSSEEVDTHILKILESLDKKHDLKLVA